MIIGIGTDLVKISRIEEIFDKYKERFINRMLNDKELGKLNSLTPSSRVKYLAKRFAAKEAFAKAIGTGFNKDVTLKNIAISNDKTGKPFYDINDKLDSYIKEKLNVSEYLIHLSITDDREYANAIAIIEK
jgi:holo-[acyl-carrier protein] synthase